MSTRGKKVLSYAEKVERAIAEIRAGRMVILVDDEDRENEGDICMAAEKVTPEAINFMAKDARGLICLTLEEEAIKRLQLPMMVANNESPFQTGFTVSIEAARGVTTGISAHDRAHTILTAVADDARPEDLVRPGHVFPLRARPGGVLTRTGQTEGSVDLARLAGLKPAGVICEIMNDDGTMARMPDLEKFGEKHGLVICSVADLIRYRLERERLVQRRTEEMVELEGLGEFRGISYQVPNDPRTHVALVRGDVRGLDPVLVRVHGSCTVGDLFGASACTCGKQLRQALKQIAEADRGVLVYLQQQGKGGASVLKCARMAPPAEGDDRKSTGPFRDYGLGAQILADLGVRKLELLTNTPKRLVGLEGYGLEVVGLVGIDVEGGTRNERSGAKRGSGSRTAGTGSRAAAKVARAATRKTKGTK